MINPSIEFLRETFVKLTKIASKAEKDGPMNIFCYFSGHGASVKTEDKINKLHIVFPSVLTQEEFATLSDDLP